MGICAVIETLNIIFNRIDLNSTLLGPFCEQDWIVNPLCAGGDLLAAHEEVVGTGEVVVVGTTHRVEGPCCFRVSVQEVQVSSELLTHDLTEFTFHVGRKVFHYVPLDPVLLQQLNAFFEGQFRNRFDESERFERELLVHSFQFVLETTFKVFENIGKHVCECVHQFVVVFLNHHFKIHSCKFTQMSMCMTVLSSKHGSNFKHSLEITHDCHLFI